MSFCSHEIQAMLSIFGGRPDWGKTLVDFFSTEKSLAPATWGLTFTTLLLVIATLFLYLDGRSKSREQLARWDREDQFKVEDAKPKAYVEIARIPEQDDVHFQCFNLGNTTFLIDKLILTISKRGTTLTHNCPGPPVLLPGHAGTIWFNCAALLEPEGGFWEVQAVFHLKGALGEQLTDPVWFYFYSESGEMRHHDWRVGRLSDRQPGTLVKEPRIIRDEAR